MNVSKLCEPVVLKLSLDMQHRSKTKATCHHSENKSVAGSEMSFFSAILATCHLM